MTPALVRRALALLATDGPIVAAPASVAGTIGGLAPLATDGELAAGALCSFLGETADPQRRRRRVDGLVARLHPGAPLVVVDHNQPRRRLARLVATLGLACRGFGPARGREPTARQLAAHGFTVERLRLAYGERVQLILVRRRTDDLPPAPPAD